MEAKELRIGNLTECYINGELKNKFHVVDADDIKIFLNNDWYVLKPIPLTEEILLRLGFNKDYKNGYIGIDSGNVDFVLTEPFVLGEWQNCYEFEFIAGGWPKLKKIEYVHDLQNFFYSLCGEELTLK